MGLSSGTSTTTQVNKPSEQQVAAGKVLTDAYNQQAPRIQQYADNIGNLIPGMIEQYRQGNPAVNAAQGYITNLLGSNIQQNPYLDQIIGRAGQDVGHAVGASMGSRGNFGGSVMAKMVADRTARAALDTRYGDYNNQMQLRAQAAGMAPSVAAAGANQIAPLLSASNFAAMTPMQAASMYASGQGGLFAGTGTSTTTQPNGGFFGSVMLPLIQAGATAAGAISSDARLKTDITRVGYTDAGAPIYTYRYMAQGPFHMGVMAQDMEQTNPAALGPEVMGFKTVRYEEVR